MIFAIGAGWGIHEFQGKIQQADLEAKDVVYNEIHVQKGGRANTVLLSDGSKVILNAATTFRYPTSFNGKNRQVYLDGEAYFEVAYGHESYSEVTLLTGRILLEAFNERGESMSRMYLKPDQKALSDNSTGSVSLQEVNASLSNAWINGEYKFKDEPLASIVKRLETGTFSLDQDILDVFRIIDYEKQFTFKRVKKDIFITSK